VPAIDQSTVESLIDKECIKYAARKISDLVNEITKIKKKTAVIFLLPMSSLMLVHCPMLNYQRMFFFVEYY